MLSVILLSMLMILLSVVSVIRHLICGNNWNWLLNVNLTYEILWTWAWSGLFVSMLEKLIWFCLSGLVILLLLMWKLMGLSLRKNRLLRCWGWLSLQNWIGTLTLSLLLKPPLSLDSFYEVSLSRGWCVSLNLPYIHAWNTVVKSGLVSLVATWNCKIIYKNGYAGLLVLHLLPVLDPLLIIKM